MRLMRAILLALLAVGVMTLAACGGGDSSSDQASNCGSTPAPALSPPGNGADAFTMGIRVNEASDIGRIESSLGDQILPRDVFLVNTEFAKASAADSEEVVEQLSDKFPCNRITTLNGLATDPNKPSYAFALVGHPDVDAILVDWEPDTYEAAGKGQWTPALEANLTRIEQHLALLSEKLKTTKTRMGLVPDYLPPWDYGRTARVVALKNFELDPTHFGYQVVQTQPNCGTPSAPGPLIGGLAADVVKQYRPLFESGGSSGQQNGPKLSPVLLQHLGFEIAFDTSPNPKASEAVERIGPQQAAQCTDQVLKEGGGAIVYWASPESIRAMLETSVGKTLRSPSSG
jgi:hypothetical protein